MVGNTVHYQEALLRYLNRCRTALTATPNAVVGW
jgi:hypothetical protein